MEEDIKIIENIIYNDEGKKMSYVDVDYSEGEEFINAVVNLIARYKELEKENKNLKEINKEHQKLNGKLQVKITELENTINGIAIQELGTSDLYKEDNQ